MTNRAYLLAIPGLVATTLVAGCVAVPPESRASSAELGVTKSVDKKVYAHMMPWFEDPSTSGNGAWGIHWTMANQNPNAIDGSGRRQIASYYYPLIGPYGSGDPDVIEYQLLLMKYSGIDGVLIDWPGKIQAWDYPKNVQNAEAIIAGAAKFGLEFGIVYEDHNVTLAHDAGIIGDEIGAAQNDMAYVRDHYFSQSNYARVNGAPLLLDFGPQTFLDPSSWSAIFSVFPTKPTFLTLWYQSQQAGGNAQGEFPWIYSDFFTGLQNFYAYRPVGVKLGVAYPGFNTFYGAGGWGGPGWGLPYNGTGTFSQALQLAANSSAGVIQLATWNDYGEGTMIEPTREFGYGFLTTLQQTLGVGYSQNELQLVDTLFHQRKQYAGNGTKQAQLDAASRALASLQVAQAESILTGGGGGAGGGGSGTAPSGNVPGRFAASSFSVKLGGQTEPCAEGGLDMGWIAAGNWFVYPITVPATGRYVIQYRVASPGGAVLSSDLNAGSIPLGSVSIPATGGWQNWTTVSQTVTLNAGSYNFGVFAQTAGWNLEWIDFAASP
jgi:hypothetical protein